MTKYIQRVALSIFKAYNQAQEGYLVDFSALINKDIKIINSTSHLYQAKNQSKEPYKLKTKEEAAQGDAPDFTYEAVAFFRREIIHNDIEYFSNFSEHTYQGQPTFNNIKDLSFIALHKSGTSNQIKSHTIVSGSVIFKVSQTHLQKSNAKNLLSLKQHDTLQGKYKESTDFNQACRICLMETDVIDNPEQLVSICDCKGSCKYVHITCLQEWICSKVQKHQSQYIISYSLNKLECEICKKKLPFQIKVKQAMHSLVEFQKPRRPYLVLERVNEQAQNKTIYVLVFKKEKISLGRGFANDLRIFDISISRSHASIAFDGENFIINDEGSKYGTMILLNKEFKIKQRVNICFRTKMYKLELINSQIKF